MALTISYNNLRNMNETNISISGFRVIGGVFTAISTSTGKLFADTGANVGDYFAWKMGGQAVKPKGFRFHVGTAWTAVGLTGIWEYRKADSTWAAFAGVVDGTNDFKTAGTNLDVTWTVPTDMGSNNTSVNGSTGAFWIRWRITALTSYTVGPQLGGTTPAVTQIYDNAVRFDTNSDYDSGTATAGATTTLTDSGKAWAVNSLVGRCITIHTGTGAGQFKRIKSNTATVITVDDQWFTTTPDSTSQYVIHGNFEDIYQADVAGGWGVVTKVGTHSYAFNCFLDLRAGAFGAFHDTVEFQYNYMWYLQEAPTSRYPFVLGYRLPNIYGLNKACFGCTLISVKDTVLDERFSGFYTASSYVFTAGNRFIQRSDYPITGADNFLKRWFNHTGNYSIRDYYEGWRSCTFSKTSPRTEVRDPIVMNGHSGIEQASASFSGVETVFNGGLGLFITNANNYSFPDFFVGLNQYDPTSSRFGSSVQFFSYTGTTSKLINVLPRQRPMGDVFSTGSTGKTQPQISIRANIQDEQGNPIQNAKMIVTDSLDANKFNVLNFDGSNDTLSAPNDSAGNQFSGSTSFSVEAWVLNRTTGGATVGKVVDKGSGSSIGYALFNDSGSWRFRIWTSGGTQTSNTIALVNNTPHHLVGVWTGSQLILYVNNVATAASTATGTATNDTGQSLFIGNNAASTNTFDGYVKRVRLFKNKALSASDVSTLWNGGLFTQNQASPISGCTAEYNFTEGSGTTVADTVGGVTATLGASTAAPTWYSNNTGLSTVVSTATTGTVGEFLSNQTVTVNGSYSLSSQPTSATKLRFVITNYADTSSGTNARFVVSGTDADGNSIQENLYLEEYGNGVYYTTNEFLTVISSGISTVQFTGTMTVDRAGMVYPMYRDIENWCAPNDINLLLAKFNPLTIKISAPGFEPFIKTETFYEKQNFNITLKRSILDLT